MYKIRKVDSVRGSMLPKIRIIWGNTSNETSSALNSIQKSQWAHVYFLRKLSWGSKDCHLLIIIVYKKKKVDSVLVSMLPKICIIWSIFSYNPYFWQHWARNWMYFSISVQYNIWNVSIFGAPSSHPDSDRHVRPLDFL